MNKRFLICLSMLISLPFMVTVCYAWPIPDISIWNWQKFTGVGDSNAVDVVAYCESGGPIVEWDWDWDTGLEGEHDPEDDEDYSSTATFWSNSPGIYEVDVEGTNGGGQSDDDWAEVYIIDVSLSGGGYIALNDRVQVGVSLSPPYPTLHAGKVVLDAISGGSNISVSYDSDGQYPCNLPATWYVVRQQVPSSVWVKGISTSSEPDDVVLRISYNNYGPDVDWNTVKFTVLEVELTANDLDGTVDDPDEENPGAFIHFNSDNDNNSDNSVGAPKRPGADYLETTASVTDEDDLKSLSMSLDPSLSEGYVVLTIPSGVKIWKSTTKGSSNLVLASGSKTWDLSNSSERSEFLSLCSSLYVEGVSTGTGNIVLKYEDPAETEITSDTVKYTLIAADCGDQPTTESEDVYYYYGGYWWLVEDFQQKQNLESWFPSLEQCEYSITDNLAPRAGSGGKRCTIPEYNCIGWSVGETNHWYNPQEIDQNFGDNDGIFEDSDMDVFYSEKKGWTLITSGSDEEKAGQAEAMYYSYGQDWDYQHDPPPSTGYHGAKKEGCSCGADKWIVFGSKCGQWERIEHVWDQLDDSSYGDPDRFYK